MKYNTLVEMDIKDLMSAITQGVQGGEHGNCPMNQDQIQPDDNVGEFGASQQTTEINILKDDDGDIRIKTAGICIKLNPAIVNALQQFMNSDAGSSEDSEGKDNG